jgi:hypothetical protein
LVGSTADVGDFMLSVEAAPPDPRYPGSRLSPNGSHGVVDRLSNLSDAWSARLREGVTYRINLAHRPTRCVRLRVFSPAARWSGDPSYGAPCGGYMLVTPGPGLGGRWTFRVETGDGRFAQDYRLTVGPARADDMSPPPVLGDRRTIHGRLEGGRLDVLDLYRFHIDSRTHVVLRMSTAPTTGLNLRLLNARGRTIRCDCGGRGNAMIRKGLHPGRYYVLVRARFRAHGSYTLRRVDRALTGLGLRVDGARAVRVPSGQTVHLTLRLHPALGGPVDVRFERFDLLSGWHFFKQTRVQIHNGRAEMAFTPPLDTKWRIEAHFRGTGQASPSDSRRVSVFVRPSDGSG